jgi:MerR family transcriptional regulator, light-induced transcriptional regulator
MDGNTKSVSVAERREDLPVRRFALRVVSELVRVNGIRSGKPNAALSDMVMRFARAGDTAILSEVYSEMTRKHVLAEDMMDIYLPDAVRRIGSDWHNEQIDILQASLAFARVQNLLRELGSAWTSDQTGRASGGRILLLLPRVEQHTLGAMFAANQLRRLGVSVKVMLVPDVRLLTELLLRNRFHGIFISVSNACAVEASGELVRDVRQRDPYPTPIVIGGGLVSGAIDDIGLARIAAMTGADIVTNDIPYALHSCGLQQCSVAAE